MTTAALALAALMCSTVGLATALALGVVLLSRHGWRRTVRTLAVPLGAFVVWFALAGHDGLKDTGDTFNASVFAKVPKFVAYQSLPGLGPHRRPGRGGRPAGRRPGGLAAVAFAQPFPAPSCRPGRGGRRRSCSTCWRPSGVTASAPPSRPPATPTSGPRCSCPPLPCFISACRLGAGPASPAGPPAGVVKGWQLAAVARVVLVLVVVAATASNVVSGVRFARSRTVYVRGLENEIVTTGALLQSHAQLARAIDAYPIWASGFAAGYLTPGLLADLYRERLLPRARPGLMTTG